MAESDQILIQRLTQQGDGEAFSIIMERYAAMVYSTCRRVLRNDAQAADAVQETFYHLLKSADRITGSLASWLHQVATRRAVDLVRQNVSRRRREESYALEAVPQADNWADVEPVVDEALEELAGESRDMLIRYYLESQSMSQIATADGISQPTVSRRIAAALEQLRDKLRDRKLMVGLAPLEAMLMKVSEPAPAALVQSLGKLTLAQAAWSSGAEAIVTSTSVTGLALQVLLAAAILVTVGVGWKVIHKARARPASNSNTAQPQNAAAAVQPSPPPTQASVATVSADATFNATTNLATPAPALPNLPAGNSSTFQFSGSSVSGGTSFQWQGGAGGSFSGGATNFGGGLPFSAGRMPARGMRPGPNRPPNFPLNRGGFTRGSVSGGGNGVQWQAAGGAGGGGFSGGTGTGGGTWGTTSGGGGGIMINNGTSQSIGSNYIVNPSQDSSKPPMRAGGGLSRGGR